MTYETRAIALIVAPEGQPMHSEMSTVVSIVDEGGGEFIEVSQAGRVDLGKIAINPDKWPALRDAIDSLIAACRTT